MVQALRTSLRYGGLRQGGLQPGLGGDSIFATSSLDLNFAKHKNLGTIVDATTGANLVDFTRASSGTYVDSEGVIRTATTNLLLRSEEFDNASWGATNASIAANTATAPNGTVTADTLIEDSTTGGHVVVQSISGAPDNTSFTSSCYCKALTRSWVAVTVVGKNGSINRGDGTSGIYLWGAQLEQSTTVGEYIPTTSTINSAPRFDHDPTTGESLGLLVEEQRTNLLHRQDEGTTFAAYSQYASGGNIYTISDGTAANFITIQTNSIVNKAASANVFVASSNIGRIDSANALTANLLAKAAYGLSNGSRSLVTLGETAVTAANPATMPVVNRLFLGSNNNGTALFANGHIRRLTYWPARLPDSTLQTITQ
jgi:hypothetical protein